MCHKNVNQGIELERVSTSHEESHNTVRREDIDDSQYDYIDNTYDCDIEDDDEVENNAVAVLQHYIIVWLSIVTSPKGKYKLSRQSLGFINYIVVIKWCLQTFIHSSTFYR